jgi:predicted ferric reductase
VARVAAGAAVLALSVVPAVAAVWWAYPDGLPLWRSLGIVTAWAGLGLLVSSLALMVREPHFARALGGLETAYRWHHRTGLAAYVLIMAHPLALALDGWAESPHIAWATLAPWAQSWPIWLGWASLLLLMLGLATTFALHLSYRRWRAFHMVLGLASVLGLMHVYVLLADATALLVLAGLMLIALGWRWVASDLGAVSHPYRATEVTHAAHDMVEVTLAPYATALKVQPGQFVLAAVGDSAEYHGCGEYHPFTVSGIGAAGELRLTIKSLGSCSRQLQGLAPGAVVRLQGPFESFLTRRRVSDQLWIAGGIGITPFMSVLRACRCPRATTLIYVYRTAADAAFLDELKAIAESDPNLELITEETGSSAADPRALLARVSRVDEREIYICGPNAMVDGLTAHLRRLGVRADSVHHERFDFR